MARFVIACPKCGKYAEAKTGFFARKKIECSCGYTIDVRTDKLMGKECPHCGNIVVFDQSKGDKAVCPVCHEPINTLAEQSKTEEFFCAQCGVRLQVNKAAELYTCPVCDHVNNVRERLASEKIKKEGIASVIKYEGDNETLIWKHPIEDFNMGSQLIVHESQEAIFFRDGQALDLFGPGRYTLETQQLPLLENLYQLPSDTEKTFHSEVYYINMATQMGIKWGTDSRVRLFDPESGMHIEIGASGEFNIRVTNSRKLLLKVVGTNRSLTQSELLGDGSRRGAFKALVMTQAKSYLAQTIKASGVNILEIDSHLMELSHALREMINEGLDEYGLMMPEFFISRIVTPDDDPNFRRMKEQYAEQYILVRQEEIRKKEAEAAAQRKEVEAQSAAQLKRIEASGNADALKIQKSAEAESYRMQAMAEAEEMRMKGYTYQQETSRQVGLEAMKNGISSEGGSLLGGIGELATLGVGVGAMGSVISMTKDAVGPLFNQSMPDIAQQALPTKPVENADTWECPCGAKELTGNFCPKCGLPKPEEVQTWDCDKCGKKGLTGNFCPECGTQRPAADRWNCVCGSKGLTGNFCPKCGRKRGEESNGGKTDL